MRAALESVRVAADAAVRAAARQQRTQYLVLRETHDPCDPLEQIAPSLAEGAEAFYWERPSDDTSLACRGSAAALETRGGDRFERAAAQARDLFERIHVSGSEPVPRLAGPLLVGGFAFESDGPRSSWWRGFPSARLTLPRESIVRVGDRCWRSRVLPLHPGEEASALFSRLREPAPGGAPAPVSAAVPGDDAEGAGGDEFEALVRNALDAIRQGRLEKVVPARSLRVVGAHPHPALDLLRALRRAHPSCAIFAVARRGGVFLGASPERLARLDGCDLELAALAGSAPRGRTPQEDAALARALLEDKKEQEEHAIVVRALREALMPHCQSLEIPQAPRLRKVEGIQHLETPIRARVPDDTHLLELAGSLHPSPAVGGAPRAEALAWLTEHEALDRGWWAAPVGFVDAAGGGELAVALRSALLRGREGRLYAGSGVVAGSDCARELRETRLKLRTLLGPLLEIRG